MKEIPFTQYLRPNRVAKKVIIIRPNPVAEKAADILAAGFTLEIEELSTGVIHMTISDPVKSEDLAMELCENGPPVVAAVDRMILNFVIPNKG